MLAREPLLKWTTALVQMEAWECASHPPSVLPSRTRQSLQWGRAKNRQGELEIFVSSNLQTLEMLSGACDFQFRVQVPNSYAGTSTLGMIWSHWHCTRLRIASVSRESFACGGSCGKAQGKSRTGSTLFLGIIAQFLDWCWLGAK